MLHKMMMVITLSGISCLANAEMILMHLATELDYQGRKTDCSLWEHGKAKLDSYYLFKGYPGSGGCHVKFTASDFYKEFQFCSIGGETGNPHNSNESGYCQITPTPESVTLSAMPYRGHYNCSFICVTNGKRSPNYQPTENK